MLVAILGFGAGAISMSAGAFVGAVAAFSLVALLAHSSRGTTASVQIILAGIAGSQLFNALTSFMITKSASSEQARGIMFWLLGNLSVAGLLVCLWYRRALDAFTFRQRRSS